MAESDIFLDLEQSPAAELAAKFSSVRFKVEAGKRDLYKEVDGAWKRWDYDSNRYV
jgi:hypothetical protein